MRKNQYTKILILIFFIGVSNMSSLFAQDQRINYPSGSYYIGQVADGKKNGKGKYVWADGSVYEGDFKDDKVNGKGRFSSQKGEVYVGDFVDENYQGKGKMFWLNGKVYEGDYKDGQPNGKGKLTLSDGTVYEGDFVNGDYVAEKRENSFLGKIQKRLTSEENIFLRKVLDSYDEDPSGKIGVNCGIGTATCKWCGRDFRYQKAYQSRVAVLKQFENPLVNAFEGIYVAFGVPMAKAAGVDVIGQMATEVKQSLREIKNGNIYECGGTVPEFCSPKCEYESKNR